MNYKTLNEIKMWVNVIPEYQIKMSTIKKYAPGLIATILADSNNKRISRFWQRRQICRFGFNRIIDGIEIHEVNEIWMWWNPNKKSIEVSQRTAWREFKYNGTQYYFSNQYYVTYSGYRTRADTAFTIRKRNNNNSYAIYAFDKQKYEDETVPVPKLVNSQLRDRVLTFFNANKYNRDFLSVLIKTTSNWETIKFYLSKPIYETAFRQGWLKFLIKHGDRSGKLNKPINCFTFDWPSKEYFSKWFDWARNQKNYNHRLWRDYIDIKNKISKNSNDFADNWRLLHDSLQAQIELKRQKQSCAADKMRSRENKYYKLGKFSNKDFKLIPKTSQTAVRSLGEFVVNCLRHRSLNLKKEIYYEVLFDLQGFAIAAGYYPNNVDNNDKDMVDAHNLGGKWEIYGVKDNHVPPKLKAIIKKQILREAQSA